MPAETADGRPCTVRVDQVSRMTVKRGTVQATEGDLVRYLDNAPDTPPDPNDELSSV